MLGQQSTLGTDLSVHAASGGARAHEAHQMLASTSAAPQRRAGSRTGCWIGGVLCVRVVEVHVRGSTVVRLRHLPHRQPTTVSYSTCPRNAGCTWVHGQRATGGLHRRLPAGAHDHPVRAQQIEP